MNSNLVEYPVKLSIDYPDRKIDRLTSFFRMFTIIPIGFVAALLIQTRVPSSLKPDRNIRNGLPHFLRRSARR